MIRSALLVALLPVLAGLVRAAEPVAPLVLEKTISLPDVVGRIDHLSVDLGRKRLLVAELGNGTLDVLDFESGKALARISGLKEPQGVAYVPASDRIVVASGGDGTVRVFRAGDLSPAGEIALGSDADNIRVDPTTGHVVVGHGSGGLAIIDPVPPRKLADIKLAAHPEAFQLDPGTERVFVNLPSARQIAVADLESGRQTGTWVVPDLKGNFPLAIGESGSRVAVAFRSPATPVLLDPKSGAVTASFPSCSDADDVFFDAERRRIYVSCGEGTVAVFQADSSSASFLASVRTSPGARTSLFVPELDRLFVAVPASRSRAEASVLVFRPVP